MRRRNRVEQLRRDIIKTATSALGFYSVIYEVEVKERYSRRFGHRLSVSLSAPKPYPSYRFCVQWDDVERLEEEIKHIGYEVELATPLVKTMDSISSMMKTASMGFINNTKFYTQ